MTPLPGRLPAFLRRHLALALAILELLPRSFHRALWLMRSCRLSEEREVTGIGFGFLPVAQRIKVVPGEAWLLLSGKKSALRTTSEFAHDCDGGCDQEHSHGDGRYHDQYELFLVGRHAVFLVDARSRDAGRSWKLCVVIHLFGAGSECSGTAMKEENCGC
jgi:hypothetical protein